MKKQPLIGGALLLASTLLVIATCTYEGAGGTTVCPDPNNPEKDPCATYKDIVAYTCNDTGSATGKKLGASTTNTMTITIYSDGNCVGSSCDGGVVFDEYEEDVVDTYCDNCGS